MRKQIYLRLLRSANSVRAYAQSRLNSALFAQRKRSNVWRLRIDVASLCAAIIALLMLAVVIMTAHIKRLNNQPPHTITQYRVRYDTIILRDTVYQPQYKIIYKQAPATIDTQAIIKDYFAQRIYIDTILNDTTGLIILKDTIQHNTITARKPHIELFPKTIYITKIKRPEPRLHFYAGISTGATTQPPGLSFGPSFMIQTKHKTNYSFTYDILNNGLYFSLYWKLF